MTAAARKPRQTTTPTEETTEMTAATRKPRATKTNAKPKAAPGQAEATPKPTQHDSEARSCLCGCEEPLVGRKAMFRPGHDARMAGVVGRALVGASPKETAALLATLPSQALRLKASRIADSQAAKIAKRKVA